ncbi:MAG: NADH-quinone oxidoreductase subunit H [Candidatus Omnitrophica bacterium]|jgi:NADH-quinone oxidoreductase subunit H|nr:NADH-quinone oxidoreductase subunit H [Candidatus Omnitrophota bacterium]
MLKALFHILIFPGLSFLFVFGFFAEYVDRKLYARLQNRIGPPWFQPLADFIKLISKQEIIPEEADNNVFKLMPLLALAASSVAILYIPISGERSVFSFNGDVIVVLYLLTIPTFAYFLGGWYSRSVYSMIGAVRSLTQLFAYEVPLFLCILASAMLADTWSLSGIAAFYNQHIGYWFCNIIGFVVALICLLGKLEKVPFDIPEAETEIVAGSFTEYNGRLLAFIRMSFNVEMVVGASLLAAVFLPFGLNLAPAGVLICYLIQVLIIIVAISFLRTLFARLRLDQMINFCWKYLAPLAFLQVLFNLTLKVVLPR